MAERFDGVIVCGAGPVGLVAALELARAQVPVLVVDSEPAIRNEPRAVVYHSPVVERLDQLGLLDDMKEVGFFKRAYHWWLRDHTPLGNISFDVLEPDDTGYPFNLHLGQPALAGIILRHLLRVPGVEVRWRHRLAAVTQDEESVTVTLESPEGVREVRARWLIGADGGHSGVRRALDLSLEGVTYPEWFVATNVRFDFEAHGFGQSNIVFDPDHWAIIVKIDRSGLWRCTYREEGTMSEEQARQRVPDRYALFHRDLAECVPEAVSPYRVHDRCTASFRIGRVLLAGDAAHLINPIGGLGLTGGILDAVRLGRTLAGVFNETRDERQLDAWADERRRVFLEITAPTAKENRRRVSERDPERQRADRERIARITKDPAAARQALLGVFQLVGRDTLA